MYRRFLVLAIAAGCALAASNAVAAYDWFFGSIGGRARLRATPNCRRARPRPGKTMWRWCSKPTSMVVVQRAGDYVFGPRARR
jgi:hypothetical protein